MTENHCLGSMLDDPNHPGWDIVIEQILADIVRLLPNEAVAEPEEDRPEEPPYEWSTEW